MLSYFAWTACRPTDNNPKQRQNRDHASQHWKKCPKKGARFLNKSRCFKSHLLSNVRTARRYKICANLLQNEATQFAVVLPVCVGPTKMPEHISLKIPFVLLCHDFFWKGKRKSEYLGIKMEHLNPYLNFFPFDFVEGFNGWVFGKSDKQ
jgi:hypothetical protein